MSATASANRAADSADLRAILETIHVCVVVPAFNAEETIVEVLQSMPRYVRTIIVVDDACTDRTAQCIETQSRVDSRVQLVRHRRNGGVGAAMRTGYQAALERGAEIVVKMDSDGQMDPSYLERLLLPIALGQADYTKGNRFLRTDAVMRMPKVRLLGNAVLSFVSKLSSGYWQLLDPTNGYTAISQEALSLLPLDRLDDRYFFESSVLIELGMMQAVVEDIAMPPRYRGETSHLSVTGSIFTFSIKHMRSFFRRLLHRYLLTDFSPVSLLLLLGAPLLTFGIVFGLRSWMLSYLYLTPATAGTVMVAAFTSAGGAYCLIQAMVYDIMATPRRPLTMPRIVGFRHSGARSGVGRETA